MVNHSNNIVLMETLSFVTEAHKYQFRKHSGLPYATHPVEVLKLVKTWGIEHLPTLSACLAHDVLEDASDVFVAKLPQVIGVEATSIVVELTFKGDVPKQEYLKSFDKKSIHSVIVKLADRICNTNDFYEEDPFYAVTYWKSANSLFEVYCARTDEIKNLFGSKSWNKSFIAYQRMIEKLQKVT